MDLFDGVQTLKQLQLANGAWLLPGFALQNEAEIISDLKQIIRQSPPQHMVTPGGFSMSVAMTNCGKLGWVTDRTGYRYEALDPSTGGPWQAMPVSFLQLANTAAAASGFANFMPDACLINRYKPSARMTLHQDKDERDFTQPIVSVSFGVPAVFLFGGFERADKALRLSLNHGDVVVWGGAARLRYHGVMRLKISHHAAFGDCRINLTFRKAQ